jgi:hypothetical protein
LFLYELIEMKKGKLKQITSNSKVIPMFPKLKNWKWNKFTMKFIKIPPDSTIMCRGVFATNLMLSVKKTAHRVAYDGRGAFAAEYDEYLDSNLLFNEPPEDLERVAVIRSDLRLAVTKKLVEYWKSAYGYSGKNHCIVPCTLSMDAKSDEPIPDLGFASDDVIFAYAGSSAKWQSFDLVEDFLSEMFESNPKAKALLLTRVDKPLDIQLKYPDRIKVAWVKPNQVHRYLNLCDYGIFLRNKSVTNQVASPTKYAEYLSAGLKVIISKHIGHYAELNEKNELGFNLDDDGFKGLTFNKLTSSDKEKLTKYAQSNYTKTSFDSEYLTLLNL